MQHVGLTITGNKVEAAGNTNRFFIKINGKNLFTYIFVTTLRLLLQGKKV
jgi:hypothetical protein